MQRRYTVRGREHTVEQLERFAALMAPEPGTRRRLLGGSLGPPCEPAELFPKPQQARARSDAAAFASAGWVFVRVPEDRWEKLCLEPGVTAARVYVDEGGRLMIGAGRVTVKLRPELSHDEALAALKDARLEVIRQLRFAPNLFEVRVPADADELDTASALEADASVEFAEPQMLEHIERRESSPALMRRHK